MLTGFVLLVFFFGFLLYYLFLRPAIPTVVQPGANVNGTGGILPQAGTNTNIQIRQNVNGGLVGQQNINVGPPTQIDQTVSASPIAQGGLTKTSALTTNRVYDTALGGDGESVYYYDKSTGLFYSVSPDGQITPLSDKVFYSVEQVYWTPDKNKAILKYPDGSTIMYDFSTKKQVTLPSHWKDFDFSPNSGQMVFKSMGDSSDNRWLAISNVDGTRAKKIELLGDKDATVYPSWSPNGQIVAMFTDGGDFDRQNLYFLGQNNENYKSTIIEGRGFEGEWSSDGNRLLYSVYNSRNDYKPSLWIVEAQGESIGQNRKQLQLETWADKCTFSDNDTIYCAVPESLQAGAGIFSNELDNSNCDIYKIDLTTGIKTKIAIPEGSHNIENIMVSANGSYLYFNSQTDGKLYKINLK